MSNDQYLNELHPNIYLNVLRASAFFSTCAFLVGVYLILFKTPKRFGTYKYFMLNITISAYLFDIYTSLIYAPLPLFPILYACALGPIQLLGQRFGGIYSYDIFIVLFGVANVSILVAIAYRYAILKGWSHWFRSKTGILVIALIELTASSPVIFTRHIAIGNQIANRNKVVEVFPYSKYVLENYYCTGVSFEYNMALTTMFMINTFAAFVIAVPIALFFILKCFTILNDFTSKISPMTRKLHRELIFSLLFQFACPLFTLVIPFVILVILGSLRIYTSTHYAQYIVLFGTFHSVGNTLMLIATVRPFRNVLLSVVGKKVEPVSWLYTTKQSGLPNAINLSQIS